MKITDRRVLRFVITESRTTVGRFSPTDIHGLFSAFGGTGSKNIQVSSWTAYNLSLLFRLLKWCLMDAPLRFFEEVFAVRFRPPRAAQIIEVSWSGRWIRVAKNRRTRRSITAVHTPQIIVNLDRSFAQRNSSLDIKFVRFVRRHSKKWSLVAGASLNLYLWSPITWALIDQNSNFFHKLVKGFLIQMHSVEVHR